jgi:hypothetical protein
MKLRGWRQWMRRSFLDVRYQWLLLQIGSRIFSSVLTFLLDSTFSPKPKVPLFIHRCEDWSLELWTSYFESSFVCVFCGSEVGTQGLTLAKKVLSPMMPAHLIEPSKFWSFWVGLFLILLNLKLLLLMEAYYHGILVIGLTSLKIS